MTYPATNSNEATKLIIDGGNQLHEIINEDAVTTITTESGEIPSVRKAITDTFLFQEPIAWNQGSDETVFNQLRTFNNETYWAPTATLSTPVPMGVTPIGDSNWKLAPVGSNNSVIRGWDTKTQEELIGGTIYPVTGTLSNGDTIPAGTTHLRISDGVDSVIVMMSPITSGVVSLLTEEGATIGATPVLFYNPTVNIYSTLSALLNGEEKTAKVGDICITLGANEIGDGGSSHLFVSAIQPTDKFYKVYGSNYLVYIEQPTLKQFGGGGNWNSVTQLGSNDTTVTQEYINILADLPNRRNGGYKNLKLGSGSFRIDTVTIPDSMGFGFQVSGDGFESTTVWNDGTWNCEIEGVLFKDFTAFNALEESGTEGDWGVSFIESALLDKRQDIDLVLSDMRIGYSAAWSKCHGRGFVMKGSNIAVYCRRILEIVCDSDAVFSGDANDSIETGMRNYTFSGLRTDNVREILGTSGTGTQRDYINGVQISSDCDLSSCQRIINDTGGGYQKMIINGVNAVNSFQNGALNVKRLRGLTLKGCDFAAQYNTEALPTTANEAMQWLVITQEANRDVKITDNKLRALTRGVVRSLGAGTSRNIDISQNNLDEFASYNDGTGTVIAYDADGPVINLNVKNNNVFSNVAQTRTYKWFDETQVDYKSLSFGDNQTNFEFEDWRGSYTPTIETGGVAITTQPTTVSGRYHIEDGYAKVDLVFNADMTGESGVIGITLPEDAEPEFSAVTGGYSGGGIYLDWTGLTLASGESILGVFVDASDERLYIQTQNAGIVSRLDASSAAGILRFRIKFEYKITQ